MLCQNQRYVFEIRHILHSLGRRPESLQYALLLTMMDGKELGERGQPWFTNRHFSPASFMSTRQIQKEWNVCFVCLFSSFFLWAGEGE